MITLIKDYTRTINSKLGYSTIRILTRNYTGQCQYYRNLDVG